MADVFISYASEDRSRAQQLAEAIASRGWSVWWDRRTIPGDNFAETIGRELDAAAVVVVLWSTESVGSRWVKDEAMRARDRGTLVPALLDDVADKIPFPLGSVDAAQLTGWGGGPHDELDRLAEAIQRRVGASPDDPVVATSPTITTTSSQDHVGAPPDDPRPVPPKPLPVPGSAPTPQARDWLPSAARAQIVLLVVAIVATAAAAGYAQYLVQAVPGDVRRYLEPAPERAFSERDRAPLIELRRRADEVIRRNTAKGRRANRLLTYPWVATGVWALVVGSAGLRRRHPSLWIGGGLIPLACAGVFGLLAGWRLGHDLGFGWPYRTQFVTTAALTVLPALVAVVLMTRWLRTQRSGRVAAPSSPPA